MAPRLKIIRIPRTPASAFDHDREISDLVRTQVRHAYEALHEWWRTAGAVQPESLQTEREAADYIRTVTRILHPEATPAVPMPAPPAPKSGVWLDDPTAAAPRRARKARKAVRKRSRSRRRTRR
jgi:hypothetical protein